MKKYRTILLSALVYGVMTAIIAAERPRVIVTSDGEIDDECSMVRFLLYANEWDIEGIITSSSQYHWQGHRWAGDDWMDPYLEAYESVYPNLVKHDPNFPTPQHLRDCSKLGNVKTEGEMDEVTEGSQLIVSVLLDQTDPRPVWLQAWGGVNTIARALKTIEQDHPDRMNEVAKKIRLFCIWEQDATYQEYIRPHWGKLGILTIISDQFEALAYRWKQIQPLEMHPYFESDWMKKHILNNHGPLCSLYKAHHETTEKNDLRYFPGDFRSEGDSPAFLHSIPTGLRSMESPDWGGWGGRYVRIRENIWLDPVTERGYQYPEGRWYGSSAWGRLASKQGKSTANNPDYRTYFKPMWRWSDALQNDFAARADWCVENFQNANHPPVVKLLHPEDLEVRRGEKVYLSAKATSDPDMDDMSCRWWQYGEADSYPSTLDIVDSEDWEINIEVPEDAEAGQSIHIVCEVSDGGSPSLTRYCRVVLNIIQ